MRLWAEGYTQKAIGERFGINDRAVSAIIQRERIKMHAYDRDELIQREIAFLDDLRTRAIEIANQPGTPVTAGKDGNLVIDPDTGTVVRSKTEQIAAMREARGTSQDMRRLCGLDQPVKTETTGQIRYEILGVSPDELK